MAYDAYCLLSTDIHNNNNNNSVAVNEFSTGVNPGLLGAALTYVIQLGGLFQWAVRQSAEVENQVIIELLTVTPASTLPLSKCSQWYYLSPLSQRFVHE
jgi:hypothetical protein